MWWAVVAVITARSHTHTQGMNEAEREILLHILKLAQISILAISKHSNRSHTHTWYERGAEKSFQVGPNAKKSPFQPIQENVLSLKLHTDTR